MEPAGRGGGARSNERAPTRSASSAPLPGTIGRHRVVRQVGEGAMGRVYLATDPDLGRDVAIKVLRLEAAGSARDAYIARFRNEARAAARFMHPNVVAVYDAGVDPTLGPYLVYEYVNGPTLRARIEESPLEPAEVIALARGVGAALDALHAAGIIHRDIKPDNILMAPDGTVKLTDFGIARVPNAQLTRDGQFLGTPAYASPEAITKGEYGVRGDEFSLGAVLYEALCGVRPFPGDDAVAVSYSVANESPHPPSRHRPTLPGAVDAVFAKALAKRQGERFASAGELSGALAGAFRGTPSATATATQPTPVKRPQHPEVVRPAGSSAASPRKERPVIAIVLLVLIVAVLGVMFARKLTGRADESGAGADASAGGARTAPGSTPGARPVIRPRPAVVPVRPGRDGGR